jgi:hypothetical protein
MINPDERRIRIPYAPRQGQAVIHQQLEAYRWAVIVIHRRFGKTVMLLNHLIKDALTTQNNDNRYAYIAPYFKQAKQLAWYYVKKYCDPIPGRVFMESELRVDLPNGSRIRLYGADNPDSMRGLYLDGAVLDEYSQINPSIFTSILRPALSDRKGWCIFSGTPNGKDHFHDLLRHAENDPEWYTAVLKASETGVVDPKELLDAQKTMSPDEYAREYECSFNSIIGKKIYPEFNRNLHVAKESLLPDRPVDIIRGWDNTGLSPAIILSYITATGQWCLFKEFCFSDCGIMDATESMILWCNQNLHPGCRYKDYSDPAGRIRDSIKMSARDYITIKAREMGQDLWLVDGIQTWKPRRESVAGRLTRMFNGEPALLIDPYGCPIAIEGFEGGYSYRELANMPGQYVEEAIKNKYSHIHDAIQYPATRLFLNNANIKSSPDGRYIEDDEDDYQQSFQFQKTGRSELGGY